MLNPQKVGIAVRCARCGKPKKPRGRSAGMGAYDSYCYQDFDGGCKGYYEPPYPGSLWPGESEAVGS